MKLTVFQKIFSWISPLFILRDASVVNPVLELYYYRGRYQLATADALYSDGIYYRPLRAAYTALQAQLPNIKKVLVLGTGLGSAVQILARKGFHPAVTLVELDAKVLDWAVTLMPKWAGKNIKPICADAQYFLDSHNEKYDLIIVDIFAGRFVPAFVITPVFLENCRSHLSSGGHLVLNYMVTNERPEEKAKAALDAAFSMVNVLRFHLNRVFIATA